MLIMTPNPHNPDGWPWLVWVNPETKETLFLAEVK